MKKNHFIMLFCLLAFICYYGYFYKIGKYPLLDVDETRYVNIAREMFMTKDFMTLYLNGDFFFEKPPLFFWLECLSFKLIGGITEFSARIPVVILSLLPTGLIFSLCKKIKGKKFAFVSIAVFLTSLEYLFMAKIAILDGVLAGLVSSSVLCYFYTFFAEEKNKKYFWALTYILSGLAVLAKGIPGVAIPALVILLSSIVFKTTKETLKYSWGVLLFLIAVLPWHITMLKLHGSLFVNEYIIKHHLLRFLGSEVIHRSEPWYFYLITLLWGLFPHIFVFVPKIFKQNLKDKFLTLNLIAAASILVFFSLSGAKLITYILPIYPFSAILIGEIWIKYIQNGDKNINRSLIVLNSLLTISVIVLMFIKFILPNGIYDDFMKIQITGLILLIPLVVFSWIFIKKQKRLKQFLALIIFMAMTSGFLTPFIYEFNYSFGQNDLMKYAKYAKENNCTLAGYLTGKKYSLLYYGNQSKVDFETDDNIVWLQKELNENNNFVIIRNKNIKDLPVKIKEKGVKYSIVEKL